VELEAFAGRVAHDILSPLGVVSFALELAGRGANEAQRARAFERGGRAVARIKSLVDGLLGFARAGARPEEGARIDVHATLSELAADLRKTAADRGVELEVDAADVGSAACSEGVLISIVANLARNAIKYMGDGAVRRIVVRARDAGASVRVEVEDTGPGLPPGAEERVFEPYVRGASARTQAGIGLGLATVKRLVEGHGGRVGVRSVPGKGCTFWFELPRARAADSAPVLADVTHATV
jgi:signal transduction histidine kinase